MKQIKRIIRNTWNSVRAALGRLLGTPASKPALQPVPVTPRRVVRRR